MEQTERQKKAIGILKNKKINECYDWLLSGVHNALIDVPNVKHVKNKRHLYCGFFYNETHYEIGIRHHNTRFLEDPYKIDIDQNTPLLGGRYHFLIKVASQLVLETKADEYSGIIKINLDNLSQVALGDWLEIIPKIVAEAREIEAKQGQQKAEEEKRKKQEEKEKKVKEIDKKIDLGKYE